MCFYIDDYDWSASVVVRKTGTVEKGIRCNECNRLMQPGETVHHIFLQEHEECRTCVYDEGKDECDCEEPRYGESFDYDRCDECDSFLVAVEAAELEAGCRHYEARPELCSMIATIADSGKDEARRYFRQAKRLFPELGKSGYLKRLWHKMFGHVVTLERM